MYLKLLLLTIGLLAIAFAGFAVKMFFKKDGEFKKQCSTVDPHTGKNDVPAKAHPVMVVVEMMMMKSMFIHTLTSKYRHFRLINSLPQYKKAANL